MPREFHGHRARDPGPLEAHNRRAPELVEQRAQAFGRDREPERTLDSSIRLPSRAAGRRSSPAARARATPTTRPLDCAYGTGRRDERRGWFRPALGRRPRPADHLPCATRPRRRLSRGLRRAGTPRVSGTASRPRSRRRRTRGTTAAVAPLIGWTSRPRRSSALRPNQSGLGDDADAGRILARPAPA